jgi:hypothetical protein
VSKLPLIPSLSRSTASIKAHELISIDSIELKVPSSARNDQVQCSDESVFALGQRQSSVGCLESVWIFGVFNQGENREGEDFVGSEGCERGHHAELHVLLHHRHQLLERLVIDYDEIAFHRRRQPLLEILHGFQCDSVVGHEHSEEKRHLGDLHELEQIRQRGEKIRLKKF